MQVFGPDTDIVNIVPMSLGVEKAAADFEALVSAPTRGELAPPPPEIAALLEELSHKVSGRASNS